MFFYQKISIIILLSAISVNHILIDVNRVNIWRSLFYHFFSESFFWKSFYFKRKHPTFNLNLDKIQIIRTFFPVKFYLASIVIELVLILKRIIAFRSLLKRKKSLIEKKVRNTWSRKNIWSMLIWRVYVNCYGDQPSFDKIKNILLISTFFRKNILCWVCFTINL